MPLQGEHIRLREVRPEDLALFVTLRNDLDTQAWGKALPPDYTEEMMRRRYLDRDFSFDRTEGTFVVEPVDGGDPLGYMAFSDVEPRHSAWWGLAMAKPSWGTGVATEASELLLHFLFEELGLRVVRLGTTSVNQRMMGLAERLGFRVAVRRRQTVFLHGAVYDGVEMDLLREEYYAARPHLTDRLPDPFALADGGERPAGS